MDNGSSSDLFTFIGFNPHVSIRGSTLHEDTVGYRPAAVAPLKGVHTRVHEALLSDVRGSAARCAPLRFSRKHFSEDVGRGRSLAGLAKI